MDKINEQFLRVKRWLERFKEVSEGREHNRESQYYEDVLYAFYQNCFHLKDWIIASGLKDQKTMNQFISSTYDLRICRDLCNASKHLVIDRNPLDPNINVKKREYSLTFGAEKPQINVIYWIHADGKIINAYDLAINCVSIWEAFLRSNNLMI